MVIATYNRAALVPRAIESVLAQEGVDVEAIVVDDGSTDDTAAVVERYAPAVTYLRQDNRERGAARNAGVAATSAPLVAFLDSDDEYLPGHLERLVAALTADPAVGLAYREAELVGPDGRVFHIAPQRPIDGAILIEAAIENRWALSSAMVRRSVLREVGGFDEGRDLSGAEDWELWVRCLGVTTVRHVPGATVRIHFHSGNTVGDAAAMERAVRTARARMLANPEVASRLAGHERELAAGLAVTIVRGYLAAGDAASARSRFVAELRQRPSILTERAARRTLARVVIGPRRR